MTKEELRKEATYTVEWESTPMIDRPLFVHGYITGAESREGKIKELEQQIEKMKRYLDCEYCEHYTQRSGCKNCNEEIKSDWKLKEEIKENA